MSRLTALKSALLACTRSAFCALSAVIFTSPLNSSAVSPPGEGAAAAGVARGAPGCPGSPPGGAPAAGVLPFACPWARFESVVAISSAFAFFRKTTWIPPSPLDGTSSCSMSSRMRWKLFSSAMMMSLFVRSSGMIFETDTSTPGCTAAAPPGGAPGAAAGWPGRPGADGASRVRFAPGRPCAWKIWLILSATSFAAA